MGEKFRIQHILENVRVGSGCITLVGSRSSMGLAISRIRDISNISRVLVGNSVLDSLETAVGKLDMVLAVGGVAITSLILTKVDIALVGILGINTIGVLILGVRVFVVGLRVSSVGCRGMVGGILGNGNGREGSKGNDGLEYRILRLKNLLWDLGLTGR